MFFCYACLPSSTRFPLKIKNKMKIILRNDLSHSLNYCIRLSYEKIVMASNENIVFTFLLKLVCDNCALGYGRKDRSPTFSRIIFAINRSAR